MPPPFTPMQTSPEAIFRYLLVSEVRILMVSGQRRSAAIRTVSGLVHSTHQGGERKVSPRTLQRWFSAFEAYGLLGLEPQPRPSLTGSRVIESHILDFFKEQKLADNRVSAPELIRRAETMGIVPKDTLDRVTTWRSLERMGVDMRRAIQPKTLDARPFAWPHRMQMVLCDGKHFRAGVQRLRRVALIFLDDATRNGLDVVVDSSENSTAYLRLLHRVVEAHGLMDGLYEDQGSAFTALDSLAVVVGLEIAPIFGKAAYPPGHGVIERFNRTLKEQVLNSLDGNPEVDADVDALELRLRHWLHTVYNHQPHEGLCEGDTPWDRWIRDERPLRFPNSKEEFDSKFVLPMERLVSNHNVVSVDGTNYEMPVGYSTEKVTIWRHLLHDRLVFVHEGKPITLQPPDLAFNAVSGRAPASSGTPPAASPTARPPSAAEIAFQRDFAPIVGPDGGFPKPKPDKE